MKRILVTGGAGFIGTHLCKRLRGDGHEVVIYDLPGCDITDGVLLECLGEWPRHEMFDEIYNLACHASPKKYQADPIKTTLTSVVGAHNVLMMATHNSAKVLQASTSEVYGDPLQHPQTEEYWGNVNPIGPRSCYDEGKRCAESLFFDYHRQYGTRIKVARIFNTYGPGMAVDDGRVVSNFIVQALRGEPLTIYGDGSQTRSFCYIDDMVEGLIRLMATGDSVTGPVNLGDPHETTVLGVASVVMNALGRPMDINSLPLPEDDPFRRQPDISRARELLRWEPKVDLRDGVQRTIDYFRGQLEEAA